MTAVNASLVMQLRERTGAGMMECKKFLVAANGDIELAITEMRKAGQAKADKKADRIAAEGAIVFARSADKKTAVMLEVNSETDFVARDSNFMTFADSAAKTALTSGITEVEQLMHHKMVDHNETVEEARQQLVAKIGENIKIRRIIRLHSDGVVGAYLHGNKMGVLLAISSVDDALAKDLAMHVAASKPMFVNSSQVSKDFLEKEREIYMAQAMESGKPKEIVEKMVEGKLKKAVEDVSLIDQAFIKDPNIKVAQLLKDKHTEITNFVLFQVGEGIEKKVDNFAEEVMAQVRG
jgi:elongation factor Ts